MKAKVGLVLLAAVLAVAALAAGRDATQTFNVILSDEDSGFLGFCTEVRIYSIDPTLGTRLSDEPVAVLSRPKSPVELTLDPGRYEIAIWMFYLPFEVKYMEFDVAADGVNAINVMTVELPRELWTY
jgi:hypothetical protein